MEYLNVVFMLFNFMVYGLYGVKTLNPGDPGSLAAIESHHLPQAGVVEVIQLCPLRAEGGEPMTPLHRV